MNGKTPNYYEFDKNKLKHFDILVHKVREAIKNSDSSIPINITTDINPLDNSISLKIEASGIQNNWGEKFNITNEQHADRIRILSEYLSNMIQEYIPECDNSCCDNTDYDKLIDELCIRAAAYSYNYTGNLTAEDVEEHIQKRLTKLSEVRSKSRYAAGPQGYPSKLDEDRDKYRIHYQGEREDI
jgi:hypothetical protein